MTGWASCGVIERLELDELTLQNGFKLTSGLWRAGSVSRSSARRSAMYMAARLRVSTFEIFLDVG